MRILLDRWPRLVEIVLALLLIISPLTVGGSIEIDVISGVAILALATLSNIKKLNRLYLLELIIAIFLLASAYIQSFPEPLPSTQHRMFIGLLVVMFAIIPHPAAKPPQDWQKLLV